MSNDAVVARDAHSYYILTFKKVQSEEEKQGILDDFVNTYDDSSCIQAEYATKTARIHDLKIYLERKLQAVAFKTEMKL